MQYFAYTRVSTKRQGRYGVSLDEQKLSIDSYAASRGLVISKWFMEQETAARTGRPQFRHMVRQLHGGQAQGLIIHKIDRGARNLRDWAEIGDLIDLGIDVRFAHDGMCLDTRGARLAADIQAVVAADYIRNLREEMRKGFIGHLRQGLYPLPAPFGYRNQGPRHIKDPATLTDWNRRLEKDGTLSQMHAWARKLTPNVIFALYRTASKSGRAAEVKAWLEIVEGM